jgi:hypothetical protein
MRNYESRVLCLLRDRPAGKSRATVRTEIIDIPPQPDMSICFLHCPERTVLPSPYQYPGADNEIHVTVGPSCFRLLLLSSGIVASYTVNLEANSHQAVVNGCIFKHLDQVTIEIGFT